MIVDEANEDLEMAVDPFIEEELPEVDSKVQDLIIKELVEKGKKKNIGSNTNASANNDSNVDIDVNVIGEVPKNDDVFLVSIDARRYDKQRIQR